MKNNLNTNRSHFADSIEKVKRGEHSDNLDDFDKDAAEGWAESGLGLSAMNRLDQKASSLFGSTGSWVLFTVIAAVITSAVVVGIVFTNQTETVQQQNLIVEQTDISTPEKFDTLSELTKIEQISAKEVIAKHDNEQQVTKVETPEKVDFEKISPEALEPLPATIETRIVEISKQKSATEIYLHQLKAIDYSQYRTKPEISIEQIILTGVPANFESEEDIKTETTTKIVQVPYMDYLDKSIAYVGKGKWKQALTRFEEILKTYPDDVNAMFYSGICYYNLQQYQQSCTQFSACLQLNFSNFNEEATWYLAKSRLSNNEKSLAKELFTAIRDNKGYYAKQAEKILKEWK